MNDNLTFELLDEVIAFQLVPIHLFECDEEICFSFDCGINGSKFPFSHFLHDLKIIDFPLGEFFKFVKLDFKFFLFGCGFQTDLPFFPPRTVHALTIFIIN